ncbi:MAG: hypothetical protein IKD46_01780 [Lentisphaeria bacterium]|nr:hypothetical protein [Lentisphaeria bacterium]
MSVFFKHVFWAFTVLAGAAVCGAEAAGDTPSASRPPVGDRRSAMREQMEKINQQLKEKFPAEYAEIEKMRGSDRMMAMRKTMELANKAGIEMPWGRRGMMGRRMGQQMEVWQQFFADLKQKAPAELAEIEKKMAADPKSAMTELKALAEKHGLKMPEGPLPRMNAQVSLNRNRNRIMVERANRILAQTRPEDYAELQKLRETDIHGARELFRKLAKEEGLTPRRLMMDPVRPVQSVSYSDKDIEELNPSSSIGSRPWGGWGGRGGFGGFGGSWGGRGGFRGR